MGAVRVKVRLTNAVDEVLVQRGLLKVEEIRSVEADALVDTGAVRTVLPADIAARLGLGTFGEEVVQYMDGRTEAVSLIGPVSVRLEGRTTVDEALVLGDEVLIGQTVLEKLDLLADCQRQRLIPNLKHPDRAVTYVKRSAARRSPVLV